MFIEPAYIVLNLPPSATSAIKTIRRRFDPGRASLEVEITLGGSCGVGTIVPGECRSKVFNILDTIAASFSPFTTAFGEVQRFADTHIFYFTMKNIEYFTEIHNRIAASTIAFSRTEFPFIPHCTLALNGQLDNEELEKLMTLEPPEGEFTIDTLSVYTLEEANSKLLHQVSLG